jgi:hypothetical protein
MHQYGFSARCKSCEYAADCAAMDDDCVHELGEVDD